MGDAEVDELDRVVFHYEDVARLEVAMDEAALVGGLEAAAGLVEDVDDALDAESRALLGDENIESHAG
ncbi:MAG: hypothetical protein R2724_30795 [Bryobacterales bacterium]